jgi:hypothetical protein
MVRRLPLKTPAFKETAAAGEVLGSLIDWNKKTFFLHPGWHRDC